MKKLCSIETQSGSFYGIYSEGKKLFIDVKGSFYEIIGFATYQIPPSEILHMAPEARPAGYDISHKIMVGRHVVWNEPGEKWGATSKIKKIHFDKESELSAA